MFINNITDIITWALVTMYSIQSQYKMDKLREATGKALLWRFNSMVFTAKTTVWLTQDARFLNTLYTIQKLKTAIKFLGFHITVKKVVYWLCLNWSWRTIYNSRCSSVALYTGKRQHHLLQPCSTSTITNKPG